MGANKNTEELLWLVKENPELPVVPMVSGLIAEDSNNYWLGCFSRAQVDSYLLGKRSHRVWFKSEDEVFDVLEDYLEYDDLEKLPDDEEGCRPYYEALPWVKAIIVYIEERI